ncbi:MAG TPA: hypothetical protein VFJ51_13645 [Nitrososphaeraceae archaeon]|nr:hypothetical protein [Nitrososphaeraceae archaeon]
MSSSEITKIEREAVQLQINLYKQMRAVTCLACEEYLHLYLLVLMHYRNLYHDRENDLLQSRILENILDLGFILCSTIKFLINIYIP